MKKEETNYKLYLVTERTLLGDRDLIPSIEKAIQGGVTIVQLREKNISTMEFYKLAKEVKALTQQYNIPLIINDRLDIALAVDAEGVHLGTNDLPISIARKLLGPDKILGASAHTLEEALQFQHEGADYLGIGAVFPTETKKDATAVGIDALKKIKEAISIPVVAIGGINETNVGNILHTNIDGIAVVSCILGKEDIFYASKTLYSKLMNL